MSLNRTGNKKIPSKYISSKPTEYYMFQQLLQVTEKEESHSICIHEKSDVY